MPRTVRSKRRYPSFFFGLAVGQLFYGPLIDRFGRRPPLLAGIGLYTLTTLLCLTTTDVAHFTTLRFFQAVGGCAGMIVGRTIVNDLFDEKESARALSLLMVVMTIGPIVAPTIGGLVLAHGDWTVIFWIMLAAGLVCGALVWFLIPETLPVEKRQRQSSAEILRTWRELLTTRGFIVPTLAGGFAQACMFAFITGSPFVFITPMASAPRSTAGCSHSSPARWLLPRNSTASHSNGRASNTFSAHRLFSTRSRDCFWPRRSRRVALSRCSFPLLVRNRRSWFCRRQCRRPAMSASGPNAGSGSSLIGALHLGCAFAVSIIAATENGSAYPMALTIAGCGVLATATWFIFRRKGSTY